MRDHANSTPPAWAETWTLTDAAECLPYHEALKVIVGPEVAEEQQNQLYAQLWQWHNDTTEQTRTPHGGDGSGGTVETPDGRWQKASDKLSEHWGRLSAIHQKALHESYLQEHGK